jgi:serine/threonine protein kinase/Tfp pilus assembly protein PilF
VAHGGMSFTLEEAAAEDKSALDTPHPGREPILRIGDYELLEIIARGGMGIVYQARQVSLNRLVALKMIRTGEFANEKEVARFRAEAEAAANLEHPNIVPIYEVGEHEGRHYYSMKLVDGGSLAGYRVRSGPRQQLSAERLDVTIPAVESMGKEPTPGRDERNGRPSDSENATALTLRGGLKAKDAARLLATIAEAVYFAHQHGTLHRDLKPGNILIDSRGQPHVADFGLAKRVGDDTLLTFSGAMLGTPSYMAPEQAAGAKGLTTAVDVYSLGAMLYEMLTGRPPFQGPTVLETLMLAREQEPVPPRALNPQVDRDLETICLKCLEKEPQKRYGSAHELAEELNRVVAGEPIHARRVSQAERFWRWCGRNPSLAGAAGVALLLLLVVAIGSPIAAFRIERERKQAEQARRNEEKQRKLAETDREKTRTEAAKSDQVARFLREMLRGAAPSVALGRDTTMLREILDQTARRLDALTNQPAVEADLRTTLGNVYSDLGQYTNAVAILREALAIRKRLHGENHPEVAMSYSDLGETFYREGNWAEAEEMHRAALGVRKNLYGEEHPDVAAALDHLAEALRARYPNDSQGAVERLFREALGMQRKLLGSEHLDVARTLNNFGLLLGSQGRWVEAIAMNQEARAIRLKLLGGEHPEVTRSGGLELVGGASQPALRFSASRSGDWASSVGWAENYNTSGDSAPALRVVNHGGDSAQGALSVSAEGTGLIARFGNENTFVSELSTNGTWTASGFDMNGDRDGKENLVPVDARTVLEKVAALPISQWNFNGAADVQHIGPMAQDFYAAFRVGTDDKHISTVDAEGVALVAIQGLNQKVEEQRSELEQKEKEIGKLKERLEKLEQLLNHQLNRLSE